MTNEALVSRIQTGIDPAENMLTLYMQMKGAIYQIAKRYSCIAELDDLAQEGYIALYEAVERYQSSGGASFSTYAWKCITGHIQRYVYNLHPVYIPAYLHVLLGKYRKFSRSFHAECGRKPSESETAYYLGITAEQAERLLKTANLESIASLDMPFGEDNSYTLADTVADHSDAYQNVLDEQEKEELKCVLWNLVDELPGEQPEVIRSRYMGNETLQDIADKTGSTRNRVQQTEYKALRTLRHPSNSSRLSPYLDEYIETHGYKSGTEWNSITERLAIIRLTNI